MEYLTIKGIDDKKCTRCSACVKDCPAGLFTAEDRSVRFDDQARKCIRCSHCIAVCGFDAIVFESDEQPFSFGKAVAPETIVPHDVFRRFMVARRSVRRFAQVPVEEQKINALLDDLRYAPSGTNSQSWEYVLVKDRTVKDFLVDTTLRGFGMVAKLLAFRWLVLPFVKDRERKLLKTPSVKETIRRLFEDRKNGRDRVLFHAPLVLIIHSPSYGHIADNDAGIAMTHAMLSAQSLGLGTCWLGFVQEASYIFKAIRKKLGIPKDHSVRGVLAIGYPDVKYCRGPVRKPLAVRII